MANDELDTALEEARARGRELLKGIILPEPADYPDLFALMEHPATVYRFLVQSHPVFNGLTGEQAYRNLDRKHVLDAVESIERGDFT